MSLSGFGKRMAFVTLLLCAVVVASIPTTLNAPTAAMLLQSQAQANAAALPHPFFGDQLNRLVTLAFGIAAFLATFYVLLRKDPWLRPESGSVFYAIAVSIMGGVVLFCGSLTWLFGENACWILVGFGSTLLVVTIVLFLGVFWKSYVRMNYLHEARGSWKFFIIPRLWRHVFPKRKTYEFEVEERKDWKRDDAHVLSGLDNCVFNRVGRGGSILITSHMVGALREDIYAFIAARLTAGDSVNYVTVVEPAFQILTGLKKRVPSIPTKRFVFIDVFSPMFGFRDDILEEVSLQVKDDGITTFEARTAGGLHAALKAAFNHIKKSQGKRKKRLPCLMVYDCLSALALADSEDQLCVFLHHMIPAERSYGMSTVLIEHSEFRKPVQAVMESLVDAVIQADDTGDARGNASVDSVDRTNRREPS